MEDLSFSRYHSDHKRYGDFLCILLSRMYLKTYPLVITSYEQVSNDSLVSLQTLTYPKSLESPWLIGKEEGRERKGKKNAQGTVGWTFKAGF